MEIYIYFYSKNSYRINTTIYDMLINMSERIAGFQDSPSLDIEVHQIH